MALALSVNALALQAPIVSRTTTIQANGVHFPWALQAPIGPVNSDIATITFGDISAAGGPSDQWDALPSSAKLQIIGAVGFLEVRERSPFAHPPKGNLFI